MLYENIKDVAKRQHVTISQIETDLNLGKSVISKWNVHRPSIDNVVMVATYLGTTVEALVGNDVRMKSDGN